MCKKYLGLAIAESNILDILLVYWKENDVGGDMNGEARGLNAEACGDKNAEAHWKKRYSTKLSDFNSRNP